MRVLAHKNLKSITEASRKRKRKEDEEKAAEDVAGFFTEFESVITKAAEDGKDFLELNYIPSNYIAIKKALIARGFKVYTNDYAESDYFLIKWDD